MTLNLMHTKQLPSPTGQNFKRTFNFPSIIKIVRWLQFAKLRAYVGKNLFHDKRFQRDYKFSMKIQTAWHVLLLPILNFCKELSLDEHCFLLTNLWVRWDEWWETDVYIQLNSFAKFVHQTYKYVTTRFSSFSFTLFLKLANKRNTLFYME